MLVLFVDDIHTTIKYESAGLVFDSKKWKCCYSNRSA